MHITRVRSTKLDSWSIEDSKFLEVIGNKIANAYYEEGKNPKSSAKSIINFDSSGERRSYIKRKYLDKIWVKRKISSPVDQLKSSGFQLTKKELEAIFLNQIPEKKPTNISHPITKNKKKVINFENMQLNKNKNLVQNKNKQSNGSDADLLDFEFDIFPKKSNIVNQQPIQKTNQTNDFLDFDFGFGSSSNVNVNTNVPAVSTQANQFSSKDVFNMNQSNKTINSNADLMQTDKYNCLSFQSKPINHINNGNAMSYNSNSSWSNKHLNFPKEYSNGFNKNEYSHKNMKINGTNGQGLQSGQKINNQFGLKDKYDVFDLCKGNYNQRFY